MRETIKKKKKKKSPPPQPASICFGINVQIRTFDIRGAFPASGAHSARFCERNGRKRFATQKCIEYSDRNKLFLC